ncbi:hypothetical protein C8Q74DRAFT_1297549 [Fomes fomentarius]|nr:hypothetical protein C8Q74DRAFT_1297549 [Fomes fomentarius]
MNDYLILLVCVLGLPVALLHAGVYCYSRGRLSSFVSNLTMIVYTGEPLLSAVANQGQREDTCAPAIAASRGHAQTLQD